MVEGTMGSNASHPPESTPQARLVQTVEDMGTMSQDALTPARLLPHWSLHPKILEMILEMAKTPPVRTLIPLTLS